MIWQIVGKHVSHLSTEINRFVKFLTMGTLFYHTCSFFCGGKLAGFISGIISALVLFGMGGIAYSIWASFGLIPLSTALLCSAVAALFTLVLIYAIEHDSYKSGLSIPFVVALGIVAGYLGKPPFELTLGLCVLTSILAVILIQEGD